MRLLKIALVVLLAVTAALYGATAAWGRSAGRENPPRITCGEQVLEVSMTDGNAVLLQGVSAWDEEDGDLTGSVIVGGVSKLVGGDTARVTYLVFDSHDNMGSAVGLIRYRDYHRPTFALEQQLEYTSTSNARLLNRVKASDVVDGDLTERVRVSNLLATDDEEVYAVTVQVTNSMGDTASVELPVIVRPSDAGRTDIMLSQYLVYVEQGGTFDPMDYVQRVSRQGRDLGTDALVCESQVDMDTPGTYWVWYYHDSEYGGSAILAVVVE